VSDDTVVSATGAQRRLRSYRGPLYARFWERRQVSPQVSRPVMANARFASVLHRLKKLTDKYSPR
jgi:hypothetical protein